MNTFVCVFQEMTDIVKAIYDMMGRFTYPALKTDTPKQHVDAFFQVRYMHPLRCCLSDFSVFLFFKQLSRKINDVLFLENGQESRRSRHSGRVYSLMSRGTCSFSELLLFLC